MRSRVLLFHCDLNTHYNLVFLNLLKGNLGTAVRDVLVTTYNGYMFFSKFASSISFSKKATSLPKMASLLLYLTKDLNLLHLFDCNVALTAKCA